MVEDDMILYVYVFYIIYNTYIYMYLYVLYMKLCIATSYIRCRYSDITMVHIIYHNIYMVEHRNIYI